MVLHPQLIPARAGGLEPKIVVIDKKEGTKISEDMDNKVVCERRMDEGLRTFKDGVCGTIRTISAGGDKRVIEQNTNLDVGYRIRKLTPRECFRLMAFSDEDFDKAKAVGISNSQLYKQAGNSIVVDVLYYIYKNLYKAMPYLFEDLKLSSFFSGIGAFESALDKFFIDINNMTSEETCPNEIIPPGGEQRVTL